ncbi:MAG: bifunctional oligoribonuclease/PAP phosphatase NrnA [Nitrospirae bacterium]|nr:bifunctional oligoribonuclease/PAP phosphatase NrnA [Nitrospirota bacterium]
MAAARLQKRSQHARPVVRSQRRAAVGATRKAAAKPFVGTDLGAHRADLDAIVRFIHKGKKFSVASHVGPDGDALASTLALAMGLKRLGKQVVPYNRDPVPQNLRFLPGWESLTSDIPSFKIFDGVFIVDCGDVDRIRDGFGAEPKPPLVNIDHHVTNPRFGTHNLILPDASASGQVVYYLLKALGVEITSELAWNIFAALVVDTGSFQYSNTTPETLRVAAEMVALGVKPEVVTESLHYHVPEKKWRLLAHSLNTLRLELGGRLGLMNVTQAMLRECGATFEDNDGFVEMIRQLDGVEVAALLKEHGADKVKVSLRAKDRADVSRVAQVFGGGGHRNAAGLTLQANLEEAERRLTAEVEKVLEEVNK